MPSHVIEPKDWTAIGLHIHARKREDGEIRVKMALGGASGTVTSSTNSEPYLQGAHYHKGLKENYLSLTGEAILLFCADKGKKKAVVLTPGEMISFSPGVPHTVLVMPSSVFFTSQSGDPIPNPDNPTRVDRYDFMDADFHVWCEQQLAQKI